MEEGYAPRSTRVTHRLSIRCKFPGALFCALSLQPSIHPFEHPPEQCFCVMCFFFALGERCFFLLLSCFFRNSWNSESGERAQNSFHASVGKEVMQQEDILLFLAKRERERKERVAAWCAQLLCVDLRLFPGDT